VRAVGREAEKIGVLGAEDAHSRESMFEDVYKDMPWHLRRQREDMEV
jgi:2-oxoisovalerate dehydrogenase E1 component subunit alpha